jgi:hypothetical protein
MELMPIKGSGRPSLNVAAMAIALTAAAFLGGGLGLLIEGGGSDDAAKPAVVEGQVADR